MSGGELEIKGKIVAAIPVRRVAEGDPEAQPQVPAGVPLKEDAPLHEVLETLPEHTDVYPPRVMWQIFREENGTGVVDTEHEFRLTTLRKERGLDLDGQRVDCDLQPEYPFVQLFSTTTKQRGEEWFKRVIFDPIPEAFPGDGCNCATHEYKATAEVRVLGGARSRDPGYEIDPHVVFHRDRDGNDPP